MNILVSNLLIVIGLLSVAACTPHLKEDFSPAPLPIQTPTPGATYQIDFSVEEFRLGESETEIIRRLGKPTNRTVRKVDFCGITEIMKMKYPGIEFWLDRDTELKNSEWNVFEIHVTSSEVSIEPNIKIGESRKSVQDRLGEPYNEVFDQKSELLFLSYATKSGDAAGLEFKLDKLKKVRLSINPC